MFTLQTLPDSGEPFDDPVGQVSGFSLHAGVAAQAHQRQKPERLCRYISCPAVSEKRQSFTPVGCQWIANLYANLLRVEMMRW